MIESIENIIVNTLEGTVDVFLKTQIKVDPEFTLTVIKDHAQLNNLDYEHLGHTGFVSKKHFDEELIRKVDKISGKGLSTEAFTKEDKTKLSEIDDITQEEINNILTN